MSMPAAAVVRRRWLQAAAAGGLWAGLGGLGPALAAAAAPAASAGARVAVEFTLDLRAEIAAGRFDPARDRVGVRGALPPLDWGRTAPATPVPGQLGLYRLLLELDPAAAGGQPVAHKFKIDRPGAPADDGWEPGRNRAFDLSAGGSDPVRVQRVFGVDPAAPPLRRTGRIERIAPQASVHVGPRELQVWLPPGYGDDPARRYPVLLLHDGQNLFDAAAAGAEWAVDETAQRLVLAGAVAPMIIVGVASTGARMDDYTPVPQRGGPALQSPVHRGGPALQSPVQRGGPALQSAVQGGGAAAYGRYLTEELQPLLQARYRTLPGREHWALGGSSLGGLVTMWLLLQHPQVFGAGLVVSPSVWWGGGMIVSAVDQAPPGLPAPRVWIDVGGREGWPMVHGARRLRDAVQARGWPHRYLEVPEAGHDEVSWAARVEGMLRFLYPA